MAADPDLVAQLRPVRLPPDFTAYDWHGGLAIFALALIAGLALAFVLRVFTQARVSAKAAAARELALARSLAPDQRLVRQSRLVAALKQRAEEKGRHTEAARRQLAEIRAAIDAELYRPSPGLDPDALDAAILKTFGSGQGR